MGVSCSTSTGAGRHGVGMQPFLRVPIDWRERLSAPPYVETLRGLILARDVFAVAEWLGEQGAPVTVSTDPDPDTVAWLADVGGPEHAARLADQHGDLPDRPGPARGASSSKARAQRRRDARARKRKR